MNTTPSQQGPETGALPTPVVGQGTTVTPPPSPLDSAMTELVRVIQRATDSLENFGQYTLADRLGVALDNLEAIMYPDKQ